MARATVIIRRASGEVLLPRTRWCASFACKLRGLMFGPALARHEALLLVEQRESRVATAIHMLFVPFDIAAIWLDANGRVVDKVRAAAWRPFYAPQAPARFTLEAHVSWLDDIAVGDQLVIDDDAD
jgi:uncharacterized membrane protein (UPF0127 family)